MTFLSNLIPPSRRGEKNVERGRAAELRGDFTAAEGYFRTAADAFDAHLARQRERNAAVRTAHLVLAGIAYVRIGRNADALAALDAALETGPIPDAYLHAGYAAAKIGDTDRAAAYWAAYPDWADQRSVARTVHEQAAALRRETTDAQSACEAVARAVLDQERENARRRLMSRGRKEVPRNRGY